ncbi:mandelate racemase/muconate lactonizing enzyme family protein [Labrys okinawensis]|uniref:mandelate racemase/muconate lactonizing enzyme family protein n=1 Tax=Labrys okinawensis TaxID=346911 RepID=UPI0039BD1B7B
MKITAVEGYHLVAPLRGAAGNANGFMTRREALLLRLVTEDGQVGWGEAGPAPAGASAWLEQVAASTLIGRDPAEIGPIWHDLMRQRGYDRGGVAMMAISAVDIALHDLVAKARGLSVAEMLGGSMRSHHFAYASGPYLAQGLDTYAGFGEEIRGFIEAGFRAVKPRVGGTNAATIRFLHDLRRDLGAEVSLMIDLNGGYSVADAEHLLAALAETGLIWAEEPVSLEDLDGNARVARGVVTPIATGESLATLQGFRSLLERAEVSIVQPDLTVCGGYTGLRQVAALASAWGVAVVPHVWGSVVGFRAALQMIATLPPTPNRRAPDYPWIEVDCGENPLMAICGPVRPDAKGRVAAPEGGGIGFDLGPERLAPWLHRGWAVR